MRLGVAQGLKVYRVQSSGCRAPSGQAEQGLKISTGIWGLRQRWVAGCRQEGTGLLFYVEPNLRQLGKESTALPETTKSMREHMDE